MSREAKGVRVRGKSSQNRVLEIRDLPRDLWRYTEGLDMLIILIIMIVALGHTCIKTANCAL